MPAKKKAHPVLVLGAMPSEIKLIQARLSRPKSGQLAIYPYLRGRIGQLDIVTAFTGVGVSNGAMCAALFLHQFKLRATIVSGTGSRLNPDVNCGDVIVSKRTLHHAAGSLSDQGMVYRKVRGSLPRRMTHFGYSPDRSLFKAATAAVVWLVPVEAGITIIFWIGLIIVAQSFEASEQRHFPAAIIGMLPGIAAWVIVLASSLVAGLVGPNGSTGLNAEFLQQQSAAGNFIAGGIALQQGFLLTAMLWSTMTVHILDREFLRAATAAGIAAALAGIGLIHGYSLSNGGIVVDIPLLQKISEPGSSAWLAAPAEAGGYLIAAMTFLAVHWTLRFTRARP